MVRLFVLRFLSVGGLVFCVGYQFDQFFDWCWYFGVGCLIESYLFKFWFGQIWDCCNYVQYWL